LFRSFLKEAAALRRVRPENRSFRTSNGSAELHMSTVHRWEL
jgi:hypothetical protein